MSTAIRVRNDSPRIESKGSTVCGDPWVPKGGMKHVANIALMISPDAAFTRGMLRGIRDFARERAGWSLFHGPFRRGIPSASALADWRGEGIIARPETPAESEYLRKLKIPIVVVGGGCPVRGWPVSRTDDDAIGRMAAEHLLERRFRHLAYCGNPCHPASERRRIAFVESAAAAGVQCLVFEPKTASPSSYLIQRELDEWIPTLPRPIGILGAWDGQAAQVLDACANTNIAVPDEVAVLGIDNDDLICDLAELPLSSITTDAHRVGFQAAKCLSKLLAGNTDVPLLHLTRPLGVNVRQSTNVLAVDDLLVRDGVGMIRAEACRGLTVAQIVRKLAVSRRSLELRFLKVLGRTPHSIIRTTRLEKAKSLLTETKLQLAEIAQLSGFTGASRLIVAFRSEYGMTPRNWRHGISEK